MEEAHTTSSVKYVFGKSAATSGLIAGFIATVIATVFGIWFPAVFLPKFDFNWLNGVIILGFGFPYDTLFIIGGIVHIVDGALFGVLFALAVWPLLSMPKGMAAMTPTNNLLKGVAFGWILWIISSAAWMPLLVGPLFATLGGVGPFLTNFDGVGYQALFANLLWHTIYGVILGLFFNPLPAGSTHTWR